MPLYEYTCQECEHQFETLVFNGEKVECPECHGTRLEKLFSLPAQPRTSSSAMPMMCDPSTPPCGAGCRKLS